MMGYRKITADAPPNKAAAFHNEPSRFTPRLASISVYSMFNGRESRRCTVRSLSRQGIKLFY
jgi:hypothetical protein